MESRNPQPQPVRDDLFDLVMIGDDTVFHEKAELEKKLNATEATLAETMKHDENTAHALKEALIQIKSLEEESKTNALTHNQLNSDTEALKKQIEALKQQANETQLQSETLSSNLQQANEIIKETSLKVNTLENENAATLHLHNQFQITITELKSTNEHQQQIIETLQQQKEIADLKILQLTDEQENLKQALEKLKTAALENKSSAPEQEKNLTPLPAPKKTFADIVKSSLFYQPPSRKKEENPSVTHPRKPKG